MEQRTTALTQGDPARMVVSKEAETGFNHNWRTLVVFKASIAPEQRQQAEGIGMDFLNHTRSVEWLHYLTCKYLISHMFRICLKRSL